MAVSNVNAYLPCEDLNVAPVNPLPTGVSSSGLVCRAWRSGRVVSVYLDITLTDELTSSKALVSTGSLPTPFGITSGSIFNNVAPYNQENFTGKALTVSVSYNGAINIIRGAAARYMITFSYITQD